MFLPKDKLQHLNTITHEGKVVVLATDAAGAVFYTVRQDGFEDSYLNTPAGQRTGWENWQTLEFADDADDQSVLAKDKAELTYQQEPDKYLLRSLYKTQKMTAVAPVQALSALGHVYIFRQSTANTLLVDRYVLDGMTNKLNRKLEVRYKRSRQKYGPTKSLKRGANGLVNVDTVDFRDANGNFFHEPTTELSLVNCLHKGWFSVVLAPTIENDVYRWHIFAYNSQTQKVELTTIRASAEGLFDFQDYTVFEETNDTLTARRIPGVIRRTLDLQGVTVSNGLAATQYDLQQAQQTQSGESQLLKTATRLLLAIPTDKGTAAFSFAIAGDGTLGEIDEIPDSQVVRSKERDVLLPLNTLDEIKAIGDKTPPAQGVIRGLAAGTAAEDCEDLVKVSTDSTAAELAAGDMVRISGTSDYQGLHQAIKVDENTFDLALPLEPGLGYWEKEEQEASGLIFDGMITAYHKSADGKLRVTCPLHGLENGDLVQIAGTEGYDATYPVRKIDDTQFVIERKWAMGEAIDVKLVSRKRRGIIFDGVDDYIELAQPLPIFSSSFTISMWVKVPANSDRGILLGDLSLPQATNINFEIYEGKLRFYWNNQPNLTGSRDLRDNQWHFISFVRDRENKKIRGYVDGVLDFEHAGAVADQQAVVAHRIGRDGRSGVTHFEGQIAELRIWKAARSAVQIRDNMYLQLTGREMGLVGYWRLGAIAEDSVVDFSVSGNDGTVYGAPFVSAATLNRKLAGGADAIKYSNPELFAVSERATYEESFEFKVNGAAPLTLADLDNADGKKLGTKIFTFSYWGQSSRSAEERTAIAAVPNKFEAVDNGWYRASCRVTIPDGVSLLRAFEIANIKGAWTSMEIRKHRIRLLSDTITAAKYTDSVTLATLADEQAGLTAKLKELEAKEVQEGTLLKEKRELEAKIAAYNAQDSTRQKIQVLESRISALSQQEQTQSARYQAEKVSPFNYYCVLSFQAAGVDRRVQAIMRDRYWLEVVGMAINDWQKVKFTSTGDGYYVMSFKAAGDGLRIQAIGYDYLSLELIGLPISDWQKVKFASTGDGYYVLSFKAGGDGQRVQAVSHDYLALEVIGFPVNEWQKVKLTSTGEQTNNNIQIAYDTWQATIAQLNQAQAELKTLKAGLLATPAEKAAWDARLAQIIQQITQVQTELNTLNTAILQAVKATQAKPQTMPAIGKDRRGLVTQGALLGFVRSASRLAAAATCEGNVQLSYVDSDGRLRQTNYDATADSQNSAFEQWLPDAHRACLNCSGDGVVKVNQALVLPSDWSIEAWFEYPFRKVAAWNTLCRESRRNGGHHVLVREGRQLGIFLSDPVQGEYFFDSGFDMRQLSGGWHHLTSVSKGDTTLFYIDGKKVGDTKAKALADAAGDLKKNPGDVAAQQKVEALKRAVLKVGGDVYAIGNYQIGGQPFGKIAEVRVWGVALSDDEVAVNSKTLLSGNEPGLLAYYPLSEAAGVEVRDHSGNGHNATTSGASWWGCTAPIGKLDEAGGADALVSAEYSTVTVENGRKRAMMRRFLAYPGVNGATLLHEKRIETLELRWIGNAQYAPTLLGYIEGPPPVPSENLTLSDDYNGATAVELTMSEDVAFNWNRAQESGLGAAVELFVGAETEAEAGIGFTTRVATMRAGFKGNFDFSYQFLNESNISSSSALKLTDKLELRGTPEASPKFPHLGTRFIPKNIGYALVISAIADVFVTRLARSGKMVGYQVQPVEGLPPDVNTITFLMNPAYTMNGSLDGLTGSGATSDRFFRHVPEMRTQYGSLYPASYYRLREAYDLKAQIEAEDKRRESYFANFDVRTVDETSLARNIDSGAGPATIGVQREEDKPGVALTEEEKKAAEAQKLASLQANANSNVDKQSQATQAKQAEIQSRITDQEKLAHATDSFAGWQKRMENLQIRAAKRNIVNTYVWDADGGLRTEQQSFANTIEHTIGGSFAMNAALGAEAKFGAMATAELTAQATVNLVQTMNKTEARSKGFELSVDLSGLEYKGITDYNDNPILPGEKVDRYRFMSFYLDGSTANFQDFFTYVVDPEWLRSNDEEARALRQAQAGKPNKAWRVLHRVTYVERPALMGFGRDARKVRAVAEVSEHQALADKVARLEEKLDAILNAVKQRSNG